MAESGTAAATMTTKQPQQILVRVEHHCRTLLVNLPPPPPTKGCRAAEADDEISLLQQQDQQKQYVLAQIASSLRFDTNTSEQQSKASPLNSSSKNETADLGEDNNHENASTTITLPPSSAKEGTAAQLLLYLSSFFEITHWAPPFCNCRVRGRILGGKGGFGTLLKGQSRQAGAKATTHFGACRDLQGRRLRHVNDAIHYTVWKEWNDRVQAGTATLDEMAAALIDTDSGLAGWHLQIPAWADVSAKKEHQKMKTLLRRWKQDQDAHKQRKQHERELQERHVASYVQAADQVTAQLESGVAAALQQGLQRKKQQQQQEQEKQQQASSNKRLKGGPEPPPCLLTLSGDAVLAVSEDVNDEDGRWRIQASQETNFCTAAVVLDAEKLQQHQQREQQQFYYEIAVVTGGLVQVGWAEAGFRPDSDAGDGVGDCAHSWGFDGSRSIILHKEATDPYGGDSPLWKAGDVVGCRWNCGTGELSFSVNGIDLGVAFSIGSNKSCYPAVSCNPGEIVELRLNPNEMDHLSALGDAVKAVGTVIATEDVTLESFLEQQETPEEEEKKEINEDDDQKPAANTGVAREEAKPSVSTALVPEPLDLGKYDSVEELEQLGLDRLKSALTALGLKCGGTLRERAARLFSVRGLEAKDYPKKLLAKPKR